VSAYLALLETFCERGQLVRPNNVVRLMQQNLGKIDFQGKSVLDIGGGMGLASFWAACMGACTVLCLEPGADGSNTLSNDAGVTASHTLSKRVKFSRMTLQELLHDPPAEKFDIVMSIASLNHIDEINCMQLHTNGGWRAYRGYIRGVRGLMNKGGTFVVMDCCRFNLLEWLQISNPLRRSIESHKHWQPSMWARLMAQEDFDLLEVRYLSLNSFGRIGGCLMNNRLWGLLGTGDFRLTFAAR